MYEPTEKHRDENDFFEVIPSLCEFHRPVRVIGIIECSLLSTVFSGKIFLKVSILIIVSVVSHFEGLHVVHFGYFI
jgi:hypothetical protein